jgi:hypothetical protein
MQRHQTKRGPKGTRKHPNEARHPRLDAWDRGQAGSLRASGRTEEIGSWVEKMFASVQWRHTYVSPLVNNFTPPDPSHKLQFPPLKPPATNTQP